MAAIGGPRSAAASDHGTSPADATVLTDGIPVSGEIENQLDEDWFQIDTVPETRYVVWVDNGTLAENHLHLIDTDGSTELDDQTKGARAGITWISTGGTYFLKMEGFLTGVGCCGDYVMLAQSVLDDHADTPSDATVQMLDTSLDGEIQYPRDLDYFLFEGTAGTTYRFTATASREEWVVMRVYAGDGTTLLASSDGLPAATVTYELTLENDGFHYVEIQPGQENMRGPYTLHISAPTNSQNFVGGASSGSTPSIGSGGAETDGDSDQSASSTSAAGAETDRDSDKSGNQDSGGCCIAASQHRHYGVLLIPLFFALRRHRSRKR
jgi:hypothetical protein